MKRFYLLFKTFVCYMLFICINEPIQAQTIYYVTQNGAGNQSGSSWTNAAPGTQLQTEINNATSGSQVWVAEGTFKPNAYPNNCSGCGTDTRNYSFQLKNNLAIYGGFAGTETTLAQRDLSANHSVLSGDIGVAGNNNDNCYHVVLSSNNNNTAILDGFSITGGNANSAGNIYLPAYVGNGVGAGMYIFGSSPQVSNCIFEGNSVPVLNSAPAGGAAMYIATSSAIITNCLYYANATVYDGIITIASVNASLSIVNCTFSGNTANSVITNYSASPTITNCIMWNNTLSLTNIYNQGSPFATSAPAVTYSDIQGGYTGTGNLNTDPLFVNTAGNDYHLKPNSPVVEKGSNTANSMSTDLDSKPRIVDGTIDIGAYEFQCAPTIITSQPQNTSVCKGSTATFTLGVTGPNLIYKWYEGAQSARSSNNSATLAITNVQPSDAGKYTVDIISSCGTVISDTAVLTVTDPATPVFTVSNNCGSSILSTTATGTLLWNTGETTPSITVTNAGNYTVTQTINGCTSAQGSGTAAPMAIPEAPVITVSDNCGSSILSTTETGTLLWSTGETTPSITVTNADSYSVTQTVNGCTSTSGLGTATPKTIPSTPVVTVSDNCGNSVLSTTATGTLLWNTGETTPSITVTNAGSYSVTQTVNACISNPGSGTATPKTAPPSPIVTVSNGCGSSTLSTTATGSLLWSTGETTPTITVTNAGSYSVTQTENGCTSTLGSGTASPKAIPEAPVITVSDNCGSSILSTTETGTLLWSTGETTPSITVTNAGSYSVTQTVIGCTSNADSGTAAPKFIPSAPLVIVSNNCGNSVLSTTATGTLLWSTGETTPSITVSNAGNYTVTQTVNGCASTAGSETATPKTIPSKPVVTVSDNCGNSVLSTTATGTLLWSTGETTPSLTVTNAGNYSVTQTVNGCASTAGSGTAAPKTIPSAPLVTVSDNCGNSVLSTTATGTLLWSTGETSPSITVSNAGNYTVTQTVNSCTSTAGSGTAAPKTIPSAPLVTVSDNCGNSVLSTTATGTLLWSTGETSPSITVSNAGNYTVTQTVNSCTSTAGSGTAAPKTIPSTPVVTVADNCGSSILSTTATGSLLWSTGETTPSITVSNAGNYTVTQTVNGCTSTAGSGIAAPKVIPNKPVITANGPTTFYKGGSVTLAAPSGLTSYHWSNGASTQSITVTTSGSYSVTVTNSNGCSSVASDPVIVTVQAPPSTLSISYMDGDYGQLINNDIRPYLQLNNDGTTAIAYQNITIRYWLTVEDFAPMTNLVIDWAQLGTGKVHMKYVKLGQPHQGAFGYIEYSFDASAGNLAAKQNSGPIQSRAGKSDWSNFNEADDYSYAAYTSYTKNSRITVYQNGSLVWGTEPAAVSAVQNLKSYSLDKSSSTTTNTMSTWLMLNNEGNTPVSYKDITMRYWFTADGNKPLNYYLDYAQLGSNNIKSKFVKLPTAFPTADTYLELSFTAPDSLYPNSSTGNILQRIAKSDWSNFNELNDYSYQAGHTMSENIHLTIYVKGQLVYGEEPAANTQSLTRLMATQTTPEQSQPLKVVLLNNPVIGNQIRFTVVAKQGEHLHINLVDMLGKVFVTQDFVQADAKDQHTISINNVAAALLFLRVSTQSEVQTVKVLNTKQ